MNRRRSLKTIFTIGTLGVTSFSIFKWVEINKSVDIQKLIDSEIIISHIVDIIIPETDTPGAKTANVHAYIINVMVNCTSLKEQNRFLNGINDLIQFTTDKYSKRFSQCTVAEKTSILQHFADNSAYKTPFINKVSNKLLGESFYSKIRRLTVEGYCLSQLGATKGLAYDYIPGTYEACVPLKPNQKSWATK